MDNLCHTLVGAAMAEAGLKRRSAYATATLLVAANLPDLDVLVFGTSTPSVSFRRGWTHGVVAQALLPLALTAVVLGWARWRRPSGPRPLPTGPRLRPGWVLACAYLALYSHVLLDFLNNYGVRLLAPLQWRWFYGDAVFIVDPWLWLALGLGAWLARRSAAPRPARIALAVAGGYVAFMLATAAVARDAVVREWRATRGFEPAALMVGPVPVSPLSHEVIVDAGDHYETGTYRFWAPRLQLDDARIPKNEWSREVRAARESPLIRGFLVWSRFPFWDVQPVTGGTLVTVRDARFRGVGARFSASALVSGSSKSGQTEPE